MRYYMTESLLQIAPEGYRPLDALPQSSPPVGGRSFSVGGFLKKAVGAVAAVGAGALTYLGVRYYQEAGYSTVVSMGTGAAIGACLYGSARFGPSEKIAGKVQDFFAKWGFEIWEGTTQLAVNAFCPRDGKGLWNADDPPASAHYGANMFFGALSSIYLLLSGRYILEKKNPPQVINLQDDPSIAPAKNRLFLEAGLDDTKWLVGEQLFKASCAALLFTLNKVGVLPAPESLWASYLLAGATIGSTSTLLFQACKRYAEQEGTPCVSLRLIEKVSYFMNLPVAGALLAANNILFKELRPYTLIPVGAIAAGNKIIALRDFELRSKNNEEVPPFVWKSKETVAQVALIALGAAWYISGLTDPKIKPDMLMSAIVNNCAMAFFAFASYPVTRLLVENWDPENESRLCNSLRFYVVDYAGFVYPYLIRRIFGVLDDNSQSLDVIAWSAYGAVWGRGAALRGIRAKDTPAKVSPIPQISSGVVLCSMAGKGVL